MALSKAAEEAFHSAIEAAYAMQEPSSSEEDRRLAGKAYVLFMEEYYALSKEHNSEQWWEAECRADASLARCRIYDV